MIEKIINKIGISKYAPPLNKTIKAEGWVIKNYNKQLFAKIVRDEFKEKNAEVFGGSPKYGYGDDAKFVLKFYTNARIDKQIFKLIDGGNKLELALMKFLPQLTWADIWEEHWKEISNDKQYKSLNFNGCKKLGTKRCLVILKQIIVNSRLT